MPAADKILKNFNLFVDGRGYAGNADNVKPPDLALSTEDYRGGGMDAPVKIDMGQEAMESTFTLSKFDPDVLKSFGFKSGNDLPLTFRGAIENLDGTVEPVKVEMRGRITTASPSEWSAGEKATLSVTVSVNYYRWEQNGEELFEIDVQNMIRRIGGEDQLEAKRNALGI